MRYRQIIKHFGSIPKTAKAVDVSRQAVWLWKSGGVPLLRQLQIEHLTGGLLKADRKW